MKAKNVKVGLRVQMKAEDNEVPLGTLGTVTELIDDVMCVHWDIHVGGWGCIYTNVPRGHGWSVQPEDVRKVKE